MDKFIEDGVEHVRLEGEALEVLSEFQKFVEKKFVEQQELANQLQDLRTGILAERARAISKIAVLLGYDPVNVHNYDLFSAYGRLDFGVFIRRLNVEDTTAETKDRVFN